MANRIYSFLKSLALTLLPESVLQPLRGWHHRRVLGSFSDSEEPDLIVVRKLVQRGTIVLDVGANFGMYTKVLSDLVGPTGRVISVEPVPQTFAALSRNIRSLGMKNVSCVNVAISDSDGEVLMELPNYDTGGINYYQATVVARGHGTTVDPNHQVRVPALRLDTLIAGKGVVDFVKCDVEGHELACLSGAQKLLNAHSPAWLVELSSDPDEAGSDGSRLFKIFADRSYVPWWFDGKKLNKRRPADRSTNYFFLKEAHVARLRNTAPTLF